MTTNMTSSRLIHINQPHHNYMRMTIRACIALPLLALSFSLALAIAMGTIRAMDAPAHIAPGQTITVEGCEYEDSCEIAYSGDGSWSISRP